MAPDPTDPHQEARMNPGDAPYVILTTKPGVFRTEAGEGAEIIET